MKPYQWARARGESKGYAAVFAFVCFVIGARHGDRP